MAETAAEALVARAGAMVPVLRERQPECEALGRVPDATAAELTRAGFYGVLAPARYGGHELGLETFSRIVVELSRGCPSTGWAYAFTAAHSLLLAALFDERCQDEVFGSGEVRMPGNIRPQPAERLAEGSLRLTGCWDYVSGCDTATHFLLGAVCPDEEPGAFTCVVDAAACSIVDNWDMHGLRGTGSKRVVADGVRVAEHRTIRSIDGTRARLYAETRDRPGRAVHANPMYGAGGIFSVLFGECAAVAVGIARGAIDLYEETLRTRTALTPPFGPLMHHPQYRRSLGEAVGRVDAAEDALRGSDRDYHAWAALDVAGEAEFGAVEEQRLILRKLVCARLAADAVDLIVRTSGSSALRRGTELERLARDMATLMTHPTVQLEACAELYGLVRFGGADHD